jgi:phosphotriesterase-related protein
MAILTRRQTLQTMGLGLTAAAFSHRAFAQQLTFPKGAIIRTLLKDLDPATLANGATLFHEHLQLGPDFNAKFSAASAAVRALNAPPSAAPPKPNPPAPAKPGPAPNPDATAAELAKAQAEGVACLVDAGHPDSGRDIKFLRAVAAKTTLPIVAGGGFYAQPWYPAEISTMKEDQILQALIKQADDDTLGAYGEIGSWDEMTADERKVFRAIGRAHVATNLPIFTHTGIPGKAAIEQLNILEDAGVDPRRVVIGHMGNLVDANLYVHKTLCRRGALLGFDRQGGNNDAQQVPMVLGLIDAGFTDNLMFSADTSSGYGKTLTVFLPKLKAAGVPDDVLHKIMVDNSRRWLAFVPKRSRKG